MLNGMRIFQRMPRHGVEMGERLRRILTERRGRFVGGEESAGPLGVTRAAVWKGIRTLRGAGYAIEGARGAGYRITDRPDRIDEGELREALRPGLPWTDVVGPAVTDSTNRVAMEMAENGAPHGTVVVADEQTAGRGRMGRRGGAPPGGKPYVAPAPRPPGPPGRCARPAARRVRDAVRGVPRRRIPRASPRVGPAGLPSGHAGSRAGPGGRRGGGGGRGGPGRGGPGAGGG